jgi:hypothetical protein
MELSPTRQKLLFVVIVVVLAALGYYLVLPALHGTSAAKAADTAGSTATPAASQAAIPTVVPVVTDSPAGTPAGGPGTVNIYDWLPFTEQDLTDAAAVTTRFCVDYDTYTYTESGTTYLAKMNGLVASELAQTLEEGYTTPGVAALRTGQRQISSGTATINTLRAFGPQSLTFVVTVTQRLVSDRGTTNASTQYAVTLTGSGTNWQVSDIELASAGNS